MPDATPYSVIRALDERDGHACAWLGYDTGRLVPQHRQGGMGGRANKHRMSNVVWLDSIINGLIESDPGFQAEAKRRGIKIPLGADPEAVSIDHEVHGCVYLIDVAPFVLPAPQEPRWASSEGAPVVTGTDGVTSRGQQENLWPETGGPDV